MKMREAGSLNFERSGLFVAVPYKRETRFHANDPVCPRGDLNPHALIRALAPQASASANSATRTSGRRAWGGPSNEDRQYHRGPSASKPSTPPRP